MNSSQEDKKIKARLLYVEDSLPLGKLFKAILETRGYSVDVAVTGEQGLAMHHQSPYDIIALDFHLPDMLGIDIATALLAESPELPILFITGKGSEEIAAQAMGIGVMHYIIKGNQEVYSKLIPLVIDQLNSIRKQKLEHAALNEAIRTNEQRMAAFFANATDSIFITGLDGQFQFANPTFLKAAGIAIEDIEGKTVHELYPENIARKIEQHARKVLENRTTGQFEISIRNQAGDDRIILIRRFPIEDENHAIVGLGGVMVDVTDKRATEFKTQEAFLQLSTILDSTNEGFITIDDTGVIETANPAAVRIFGYEPSELIGQDVSILMLEQEREAHKDYIQHSESVAPRIIHKTRDLVGRRKDGSLFPLELNISPMELDGKKKVVGCFQDITERKTRENELLRSDERLKRSQEFANIGTWDWNIQTGDLFWSKQIATLFGYPQGELETTYENFVAALHPDDREAVTSAVNACVADNADYDIEHRVVWPGGTVRWLHEKGDVIRDADGAAERMLGVVSDITQQKNLEQALENARGNLELQVEKRTHELQHAKEAAERADHAKSEFLANMSHELRTPLNGILGFTEMMKSETFGPIDNETYKTYVDDIHYSGDYLLKIINEILDISHIESGEAEMEMVNVDIHEAFDFCTHTLAQMAEKNGISIKIDIDADFPELFADRTRLQQIVMNLLSNGIMYNNAGGEVTLRAKVRSNNDLAIVVEDNGIGINKNYIHRVMRRFEKAHSSHTRTSSGIGLGLSVVRLLCDRHGASFTLESEEGKGTVAMVLFPKDRLANLSES